jgi:hypothetical protein
MHGLHLETALKLEAIDPLERLKEFCTKIEHNFRFSFIRFENGILCGCGVFYAETEDSCTSDLISEAKFVPTTDKLEAQRTVAAIILDRLGLAPPEDEPPKTQLPDLEEPMMNIVNSGMKLMMNMVNEMVPQASNNP